MNDFVRIKDFKIGINHPCLIIAEAGVNHNGDINIAHKLIEAAKLAGADAVKFQSFKAESLVTKYSKKADYQLKTTNGDNSQFSMLKKLELSKQDQAQLKKHCDDENILYLCTPYEQNSADLLENIGVDAYKIASTDTSNVPFLRYLAKKEIPVILSTGMSNLGDIEESVNELKFHGLNGKIIILQCTSEYPAPLEDINLRAMKTMQLAFGCPVGFSDHTSGIGASPWAVAAGACVVEKHFTLDRNMKGPDHKASVETKEMAQLVRVIRNVELALGDGMKRIMPSERKNKSKMQKSLVANREISAGRMIRPEDLTCKRPGTGLPPNWFDRVIGTQAAKTINKDDVLNLDSISWKTE
ncbi:N-acetylneuraminate synthase [Desulfobacula toluolica]|uniref:NeuB: N-acetylneuraminate synthase n=1 Tax=Desulfobacula toluolica (strain DSM 7467 / Tol2) TaxID=651182 RepID=K0NRV7_DESTT|nr:N-acetylneuraminate synthase [Desulfobacula toluolica]CCK81697.1 NeuB: N-acetylneuraminate synthase [Desulfobacula toluolica Tol2]